MANAATATESMQPSMDDFEAMLNESLDNNDLVEGLSLIHI